VGGLMVGAFECPHTDMPPQVVARNAGGRIPADAENELYDDSVDKAGPALEAAMKLVPSLASVGVKQFLHGPDCHSADHEPIMGRAPGTANVFVAAGFNSQGIQTGPGVGRALAEWVVHGDPSSGAFAGLDFSMCDVRRFHPPSVSCAEWGTARALEGYAKEYGLHPPQEQWEAGRGVRLSALHERLQRAGALFGSVGAAGWERPLHFVPGEERAELYQDEELSFDHNACDWVRRAAAEHAACRNGVALFDLSSFGKVVVSGGAAEQLLEWSMSCPVAACADGRVSYTQAMNVSRSPLCSRTSSHTSCPHIMQRVPLLFADAQRARRDRERPHDGAAAA